LTTTEEEGNRTNIDLPSIAATADGHVHIAWHDYRNNDTFQIFYIELDRELRISEMPISEAFEACLGASIAAGSDGSLHTSWMASTPTDEHDIYYRRRTPPPR
jgi:hypothetical protein